ncbi:MAG: FkbM family methyltransferase [Acidobacteriota bacterium]
MDWTNRLEPLGVFPESTGTFILQVDWRSGERSGSSELDFEVRSVEDPLPVPTRIEIDGLRLWTPSAFEARALLDHKKKVQKEIRSLVEPGDVIFDVGANIGFHASHFALATGESGYVYCLEANPICVQMLRANLVGQGLENTEILPVALLHHSGVSSFTLNYGNTNLGVSEASGFAVQKPGHRIQVPCYAFDDLMREFDLREPDLIKLDVEGAEGYALEGMRECLEKKRPKLLIEVHGKFCAAAVFEQLEALDYRFSDPAQGTEIRADEASRTDRVFQLVARPE